MNWIKNSLLFVISLAVALVVLELVLRFLETDPADTTGSGNQYVVYQFDDVLGWSNKPFAQMQFAREEFNYPVRINSIGYRTAELAINTRKILVLGDSFTWGIGVSDQERFTELLESRLGKKWQVVNAAVSGFSPIQYLLQVEQLVHLVQPEYIVIALCLGNDVVDSVSPWRYGYSKPYAALVEENLEIEGPSLNISRFGDSSAGSLRLFHVLSGLTTQIFQNYNDRKLSELDFYLDPGYLDMAKSTDVNQAYDVFSVLMSNIRKTAVRSGMENDSILAALISTKLDEGLYDPSWFGESKIHYDALNVTLNGNRVSEILSDLEFEFIDTRTFIDESDFWKVDAHWNRHGHEKLANALSHIFENKHD